MDALVSESVAHFECLSKCWQNDRAFQMPSGEEDLCLLVVDVPTKYEGEGEFSALTGGLTSSP